jgi:ubiquitin-like modifier-activating enzyme ATG7
MEKVKEDVSLLHDLIRQHDVIFLLTDSRESRWLPTVIASVEKKVRFQIKQLFDK